MLHGLTMVHQSAVRLSVASAVQKLHFFGTLPTAGIDFELSAKPK